MGENASEQKRYKNSSLKLQQKMTTLEKEYKNFIKTSSLTKKCNSSDNLVQFDDHSSPRNLMSALQHPTTIATRRSRSRSRSRRRSLSFSYCSPSTVISGSSGEVWRVRDNELAVEESIRRDRKLGFQTGKLRGRRLFEDESEVSYVEESDVAADDNGYHIHYVCDERNVDHEVVKEVNKESRVVGKNKLFVGDVTRLGKGKMMFIIVGLLLVFVLICFILVGGFDGGEVKVVVIPT